MCVCVCALVSKFQSMVSMFYILLWFEEYFFNNYIYIYIYIYIKISGTGIVEFNKSWIIEHLYAQISNILFGLLSAHPITPLISLL